MSDTPRTNNFDWSFHLLFAEAQKMECELNAAKERIKRLIAERDTARRQADQNYKLREEFMNLLGTDDVEQGVAVVRGLKERIKRLEENGDDCANLLDAIRPNTAAFERWCLAKEAKP
jgi:hypothetical protein